MVDVPLNVASGFCQSCKLPVVIINGRIPHPHPWDETAELTVEVDGVTQLPTATWHRSDCQGDVQIRWDEVL